jgi:Zn2+/Cd2+-exporting ATPase
MTTTALDLPVVLPRGAECAECVEEFGDGLRRLKGVRDVTADVPRGLLHVSFDNDLIAYDELTRDARRIGAAAHCAMHCPRDDHDPDGHAGHEACNCELVVEPAGDERYEQRLTHVTGLDCADCALRLEGALQHTDGVVSATTSFGASTLKVVFDPHEIVFDQVLERVRRLGYDTLEGKQARERQAHGGPLVFDVRGMDCADCAARLESRLGRLDGVETVRVDFGIGRLTAEVTSGAASPEAALRTTASRLGYELVPLADARAAGGETVEGRSPLFDARTVLTAASGVAVAAGFAAEAVSPWLSPYLFAASMVAGGWLTARAAWYSVRARSIDMNVLMTIAALGAAAIGQWSEAGLVVFLFSFGNLLQAVTMDRTRRAVRGLVSLTPAEAHLVDGDHLHTIAAAAIRPGDIVQALPGERLPVDGSVVAGQAGVDQSPVTGESMPVSKGPGEEVFAGSIVQGGTLTVRATTTVTDNTIAKIIHLVEEAQAQRAPLQTTIDRFASKYTPVVIAAAAAVALLPPLLFGQPFSTWFYRGLALLIISCPCALVISTPVSFLAALGAATRRGVLIKGGAYLERAGALRAVAFDKTGTLTTGVPRVTDVVSLDGDQGERVLLRAAAVERHSEHPLARAIVDEAQRLVAGDGKAAGDGHGAAGDPQGAADDPQGAAGYGAAGDGASGSDRPEPVVTRFRAIAGQGARADLDGETVLVGKPELFDAMGSLTAPPGRDGLFAAELRRLELEGKTVVVVGTPERVEGLVAVADSVRPEARDALASLRRRGVRHIAVLTGDNQATGEAVGREVGVDEVRAGLLPEEKVDEVRRLAARFGGVAMIGDGVNDAPALAAADIGIAMGVAGSDAALETADIALMGDDLSALAATFQLSRATTRVIRENIALAIAIKTVFLVLAPLGLVTLWMAVFADMGTSLAVIGNGMRLRLAVRRNQRPA